MLAHGVTRETQDLDLWLSPTVEDAQRLAVLFAKAHPQYSYEQWVAHIQRPNLRMAYPDDYAKTADILTTIDGADFEEAYKRRVVGKFGGLALPVVSLEDLIALKKISHDSGNVPQAKARDAADLELLANLGKS